MGERMIIVGGGVSGLAAGIFAQINGYETAIFEKNNVPGGLCTGWERQGYTVEGCIHWLLGTQPDSAFFRAWKAVGVDLIDAYPFEEFYHLEDGDTRLVWYSNLERLEDELLVHAPEDAVRVKQMLADARTFATLDMPIDQPRDLFGWKEGLQALWSMRSFVRPMRKYQARTVEEYCSRFQNTWLRRLLTRFIPGEYSMLALLATLAALHNGDVGFPKGGALQLAADMATRYEAVGGQLHLGQPVESIVIEADRAVGVKLQDGTTVPADSVVASVDANHLFRHLLADEHTPAGMDRNFRHLDTFTSCQVSFGVNADLRSEPHTLYLRLPQPVNLAGLENKNMNFRHYCYDSDLQPPGKSLVISTIFADYVHWEALAQDSAAYQAAKEQLATITQEQLEKRFPQVSGRVEMVDVATPLTYQRYTNVWHGSYMGWTIGPKEEPVQLPWQHPDLSGLYMVGQWFDSMSGLPGSMLTGRYLIQRLCRREDRPFIVDPGTA